MAPSREWPIRFFLFGEDNGHWHTVSAWTDLIVHRSVSYLADQEVDTFRTWLPYLSAPYARHSAAANAEWGRSHRHHGHFNGAPGALEATLMRKCLVFAERLPERPHLVVWCRDTDGQDDRRVGPLQAVKASDWSFEVVLAIAHPEIEAWQIAMWSPRDAEERTRLEALCSKLNFDPTREPSRLSSSPQSPRDAKRVARELQLDERWRSATVEQLRRTDSSVGIAQFVHDVEVAAGKLFPGS
jgi:hypothetical protein